MSLLGQVRQVPLDVRFLKFNICAGKGYLPDERKDPKPMALF
jgi:hypothetical protein